MIEVKVSPFGSAVALDPARRVPRNDQPAPLAVPVLWRDPIEPCGAVPPLTPSSATHLPAMRAGFPGLPLPLHREAAREAAVHDVEAIRRHPVTDRSLPGSLPRLNHAIPVALD